ncbi:MAG TPA: hypothetical protein VHB99_05870 [Pirellulales bacterium]|nr:hypothetical protein [Pirellulales bacterium]
MNEPLFRRAGALLFADQADVLRSMSRGFHGKDAELDLGTMLSCLLVAAAFFIAIGLLSRWAAPKERSGSYRSPRALFRGLCRAHGLDAAQRRLLLRLARSRQMPQPAGLFLQPECFAASTLSPELQGQNEALQSLCATIFGELRANAPV